MSVFAFTENGAIVGGLFGARQNAEQQEFADDAPEVLAFKATLARYNPDVAASQAKASAKALLQSGKAPLMMAARALVNLVRKELNRLRENPTTTFPPISVSALKTALEAEIDALP